MDAGFASRVENRAPRFDGGDVGAAERSHHTVVNLQGKPINVGQHVVKGGARLRVSRAKLRSITRLRHATWLHPCGFRSHDCSRVINGVFTAALDGGEAANLGAYPPCSAAVHVRVRISMGQPKATAAASRVGRSA